MSEKYSDGVKAVLGLLKQLKHDGVFYIINADGPWRIEIADDVDDGLSEIKAALARLKELEVFIAGEAWREAMRHGTPEQVEKLTAFLIDKEQEP